MRKWCSASKLMQKTSLAPISAALMQMDKFSSSSRRDWSPYLEPSLRAAEFDRFLVYFVPHGHLIGRGGWPGLGRIHVGQSKAHKIGQDQSHSKIVGNAYPDPLPEARQRSSLTIGSCNIRKPKDASFRPT